MTLHKTVKDTVERCKETTSPLAIFKADSPNRFNVLFADTVLTAKAIATDVNFICLFGSGENDNDIDRLAETLTNIV